MCVNGCFYSSVFHLCFCDKFSTQISKFGWIKLSFFLFPVFHLSLYLGLPTYLDTQFAVVPWDFFSLSDLQLSISLSPCHVNFLFPLVAFKGSLQRIHTLAKIAAEFMLTVFPLPATEERQEGVELEIRDALGRRSCLFAYWVLGKPLLRASGFHSCILRGAE